MCDTKCVGDRDQLAAVASGHGWRQGADVDCKDDDAERRGGKAPRDRARRLRRNRRRG